MFEKKDEELLLGYLLETLDEEVSAEVSVRLQADRDFQSNYHILTSFLSPLLAVREDEIHRTEIPKNLAVRTMAFIHRNLPCATAVAVSAEYRDSVTLVHQAVSQEALFSSPGNSGGHFEDESVTDVWRNSETISSGCQETHVSPRDFPKKKEMPEVGSSREKAEAAAEPAMREMPENPHFRRFRGVNILIIFSLLGIFSLMMLPALLLSRQQARMEACGENLMDIGRGLQQFSLLHDGFFPGVRQVLDPAHRIAGIYGPALVEAGFIEPATLFCPAVSRDEPLPEVPHLSRMVQTETPLESEKFHRAAGGDYAYHVGYTRDGVYFPPRARETDSSTQVLMADAPLQVKIGCERGMCGVDLTPGTREVNNHGRYGLNLLFADGHVSASAVPELPREDGSRDHLYRNDAGQCAPGIGEKDVVLGRSELRVSVSD